MEEMAAYQFEGEGGEAQLADAIRLRLPPMSQYPGSDPHDDCCRASIPGLCRAWLVMGHARCQVGVVNFRVEKGPPAHTVTPAPKLPKAGVLERFTVYFG